MSSSTNKKEKSKRNKIEDKIERKKKPSPTPPIKNKRKTEQKTEQREPEKKKTTMAGKCQTGDMMNIGWTVEVQDALDKKPKRDKKPGGTANKETLSGKIKRLVWTSSGNKLSGKQTGDCLKLKTPKKILDTIVVDAGGVKGVVNMIDNLVVVNPKTRDSELYKKFKLAFGYYSIATGVLSRVGPTIFKRESSKSYWGEMENKYFADAKFLSAFSAPTWLGNEEVTEAYLGSDRVESVHKFVDTQDDYEDWSPECKVCTIYEVFNLKTISDTRIVLKHKVTAHGIKALAVWIPENALDEIEGFTGMLSDEANKAYMEQFNTSDNELHIGTTIDAVPRKKEVESEHFAVDVTKLSEEISNTLDTGNKRGYILPGPPGTGKTTITSQICNTLSEYPVIHVKPEAFALHGYISKLESAIEIFAPCIVVFEDMDSLDLKTKNTSTGALLTLIDNTKLKKSVVYLATVNDTKLLNYTITRPGRFDVVLDVREPKTVKEVKQVVSEGVKFIKDFDCDDAVSAAGWWNLFKMRGLTHAEIGEIYKAAHLSDNGINKASIAASIKQYKQTVKNLKKYKIKEEE